MRKTVRDLIVATPALTAIIPAARWIAAGAVVDNPTTGPWAVLRWIAPVSSDSGRWLKQLRVDVHDKRGSYTRINQVLGSPDRGDGIYGLFAPLVNHIGVDGRITEMTYLGHGGDQEDDTYLTNYSFSSWQVIGVDL
jgi:hypothetical protein